MRSRSRVLVCAVCALLVHVGPAARSSAAQQPAPGTGVIGSYYPTQLMPGQTNVLHIALVRNNPVQSIEITPSAGVTVMGMTERDLHQGSSWWEVTLAVAKDAAPGPRMLVAVQPTGRTAPVTITIPNHVPAISGLKVVSAKKADPNITVQFSAADQGGTFGKVPYVWFLLSCGAGQPEAGVVQGTFDNGTLRAAIPNPRALAGHAGAPAAGDHCDLQLRATDATGTDSNTATTTFDFN